MFENFFADPKTILLGVLTGLVFGFLLQKGGVTRYDVIVNQFRFRDHTVLKTMLSAIVVGAIGVYAMLGLGLIESLHVKGAQLGLNAVGGGIFGVGMVLLGYCPGTALAAAGQGSRDAIVGIIGAIVGAAVYAEIFPFVDRTFGSMGDLGKITLAGAAHVSPWVIIAALTAASVSLFIWLERRRTPSTSA